MMDMHDMTPEQKREMKMKWREHAAMRVLAAVIVVVFVFWCGFEFGEIRADVGTMHGGYGMMTQGSWGGTRVMRGVNPGGPMMPATTQTTGTAAGGSTSGAAQ